MIKLTAAAATSPHGYEIPCLHNISGSEKLVVVISHGFASDKNSSTGQMLLQELAKHGAAGLCYDLPAHGESRVDGHHLRLPECLSSLQAAEQLAQQLAPQAQIAYFSSSFGAYINLLYLALLPHAGKRSFLRCAAVTMPQLFFADTTAEQRLLLEQQGEILLESGFGRPLIITNGFYEDLAAYDVFALCKPDMAEMRMIHGTDDEEVPLADAQRFAADFAVPLTIVPGADHRFTNPGGMEQVVQEAADFLLHGI